MSSVRKVVRLFSVVIVVSALVILVYVTFVNSPYQEQMYLSRIQYSPHRSSSNTEPRSVYHASSHDEIFLDWNNEKKDSQLHSDTDIDTRNSELDILSLIPDFSLKHRNISNLLQIKKASSKDEAYSVPQLEVHTTPCSDELCTEFLSQENKVRYQHCSGESALEQNNTPQEQEAISCHFVKGDGRPPVALVSLPGSGNTWVRQLLEAATGVCTGGIYCDISLRAKGFAGEFIRGSSVLVVKTHEDRPLWLRVRGPPSSSVSKKLLSDAGEEGQYGAAIFLVRNPLHALVAEWNRKVTNNFSPRTVRLDSHVERAGKEWFGENEKWNSFVHEQSNRWQAMIKNWVILKNHNPVLVAKYEELQRNPLAEVQKMLKFLNTDVDSSGNYLENNHDVGSFSGFQRNHSLRYEHFTLRQKQYVLSSVAAAMKSLVKHGLTSDINYLQ